MYQEPRIEIEELEVADVISTEGPGDPSEWGDDDW